MTVPPAQQPPVIAVEPSPEGGQTVVPSVTGRVLGDYAAGAPYQVELRVLNRSQIVELFKITALPGTALVTPSTTSVAVYPSGDATATFTVVPPPLGFPGQPRPDLLQFEVQAEGGGGVAHVRAFTDGVNAPVLVTGSEPTSGSAPVEPSWELLSDHPVEASADVLGFARLARRMAEIILGARSATPFTIGIQGGWGVGKSSLMQMIRREIEERTAARGRRIPVVWFNAWTAEGSNALTALIRSVLHELDPSVLRRLLRKTRRSHWLLAPFVIAMSWLGLRRLADDMWARFSVDATQRNEISKELRQALADWADRDRPLDVRRMLVVFIDDLDRCSPENIVQVLDAVRLYLDAPGLIFVIGYDHGVVVDALSQARGPSAGTRSRTYLEKIIQVDHVVPLPDLQQAREMATACAHRCGVEEILAPPELNLIVERTDRNPRRLKRFLNTFVLSRKLDDSTARLRPDEHIKMLLLRMYFPDLFRSVLMEPERDILGQLVELVRYRAAVTAGQPSDQEQVEWLFHVSGVAPPAPDENQTAALARLESHMPDTVIQLSRDGDLFSLAWSLGTTDQRRHLLARARAQVPAETPAQTSRPSRTSLPAASAPKEPQQPVSESRVCPQCGAAVGPDDRHFCPTCGTYLDW